MLKHKEIILTEKKTPRIYVEKDKGLRNSRTGTKVKKLKSKALYILMSPKCDAMGFDNHDSSWIKIPIIFVFLFLIIWIVQLYL